MTINVVTVNNTWILNKIARRIVDANQTGHEFLLSFEPREDVDANIYIDAQNCFFQKTNTLDIPWFTHIDQDNINTVNINILKADFILHQCSRYMNIFSKYYSQNNMEVMMPAPESQFILKKPIIGIFQRGGFVGKGVTFLLQMTDLELLKKFRWLFVGKGWDNVVAKWQTGGIVCKIIDGECHQHYNEIYDLIDYLLVPSLWEGGPMSLLEASAKGIPIISANVGWAGQEIVVDYLFRPNDNMRFREILDEIIAPYEARRNQIENLSYAKCAEQIVGVVEKIRERKE